MPVEDTDRSEDGVVDRFTGVVGEALVAWDVIEVVGAHARVSVERKRETSQLDRFDTRVDYLIIRRIAPLDNKEL